MVEVYFLIHGVFETFDEGYVIAFENLGVVCMFLKYKMLHMISPDIVSTRADTWHFWSILSNDLMYKDCVFLCCLYCVLI